MKHYICPECEDEGDLPDDSRIKFCSVCAGDTGRDVRLRFLSVKRNPKCWKKAKTELSSKNDIDSYTSIAARYDD